MLPPVPRQSHASPAANSSVAPCLQPSSDMTCILCLSMQVT